jgi:hypothetical protein
MRRIFRSNLKIVLLLGFLTLPRIGYTQDENDTIYRFDRPPFVNPAIVQDFRMWLSDLGDHVVAINLSDAQNSNRYFQGSNGLKIRQDSGEKYPFVYFEYSSADKDDDKDEFGYRYIGKTKNGIIVILTGGRGNYQNLMLVTIRRDTTIELDLVGDTLSDSISHTLKSKPMVILKKLTDIYVSYNGNVKLNGDKLIVHDIADNPPLNEEINYTLDLLKIRDQ